MYTDLFTPKFASLIRFLLDTIVFITADVAALIVQSAGGAMASIADTPEGSEQGAKIMVGGILVQMGKPLITSFTNIHAMLTSSVLSGYYDLLYCCH